MTHINDFNDLHKASGLDAIRQIFKLAIDSMEITSSNHLQSKPNSPNSLNSPIKLDSRITPEYPALPPIMNVKGLYGLLGRIACEGSKNSEADPIAICCNIFSRFGSTIGRRVVQNIGDGELHARPFILVVGKSAKARKGTAENFPKKVFDMAEEIKKETWKKLKIHLGGLSSGEGLTFALRDSSEIVEANNNPIDHGISDKRMLVIESEFSNILTVIKRESNTLSAIIRNLWDGKDIEPLTKHNRLRASKPHCTILGHITSFELLERLSKNDLSNGFLNRFILIHVSRKKLVPNPVPTDLKILETLAYELVSVYEFLDNCSSEVEPLIMVMDDEAMKHWCNIYETVSKDREGQ